MKKDTISSSLSSFLIMCGTVLGVIIGGQFTTKVITIHEDPKYPVVDEDFNFYLSKNGYLGWQMGCNYRFGSNAEWNEEKQEYGKQEYLRCANGITYEALTFP